MTGTLIGKLLRDLRIGLVVTAAILIAFQCLWVKVTERITADLMPELKWLAAGRGLLPKDVEKVMFEGPGKVTKTFMGGEKYSIFKLRDMLSVGYVHPIMIVLFAVWAVGRSSSAIAGELDRGTMELLLAQPVPRYRILVAHLVVDALTIPILALSVWAGSWLGLRLTQIHDFDLNTGKSGDLIDPAMYGPAILNVAALIFAVSGYTIWISSRGRFRWRTLGLAVFITLIQFLINVIGQLWEPMQRLRPFTVFYYYEPQQLILDRNWILDIGTLFPESSWTVRVNGTLLLFSVGAIGYALAFWTFCRRDLPAPL